MLRKGNVPGKVAVGAVTLVLICLMWICLPGPPALLAQQPAAPLSTLLEAVDQRAALSLDGDRHHRVDPYLNGLGGGRGPGHAVQVLPWKL